MADLVEDAPAHADPRGLPAITTGSPRSAFVPRSGPRRTEGDQSGGSAGVPSGVAGTELRPERGSEPRRVGVFLFYLISPGRRRSRALCAPGQGANECADAGPDHTQYQPEHRQNIARFVKGELASSMVLCVLAAGVAPSAPAGAGAPQP